MQAAGGFPIDLILFAMIAAFLVLRLRSILGRRTGFDGTPAPAATPAPRAAAGAGQSGPVASPRALPDAAGPVGRTMAEMQRTDLRSIEEVTITDAVLAGQHATLSVRFVSNQVNITSDTAGQPVAGTDAVTEIHDLWSFVRDLGQPDLTWRLSAARSA